MRSILNSAITVSFALILLVQTAYGLSLQEAKQQGLVGETARGYLEAVQASASKDVKGLISDVNSKRKAKYQQIAKKNGTALQAVETLAGKKAIDKTQAGGYVKRNSSKWEKK